MFEFLEDVDWKRAGIFGGIFVVIVAVLFYLFAMPSEDKETEVQETVEVTDDDYKGMEEVAYKFMDTSGKFGYDMEAVLASNALASTAKTMADNPAAVDQSLYRSRARAYMDSRTYITEGSPAYFDSSKVTMWNENVELGTNHKRKFTISNISIEKPEKMTTIEYKGTQVPFATVNVTSDHEASFAENTVHDTSWDGTYYLKKRKFAKHHTTLKLIRYAGEWKVYSVKQDDNKFLLSAWSEPDEREYMSELSDNYEEYGTAKINVADAPQLDENGNPVTTTPAIGSEESTSTSTSTEPTPAP